ncbi:hypothetical protein Anapl_11684 [Anas platyrhynchos]|uniref:Uncharacterized protein n=1 Tax=Anas platyrhynchos TaxID=8839 RepID=R0L8Z9_ANAPL|nr:hypothetical protein Anapl_11684 [Anas platyrhynchos]
MQAGKLRFLLSHCSADRRRTRRSREQFQYFNMLASGTSAPVGREGGIINQIPIACNEISSCVSQHITGQEVFGFCDWQLCHHKLKEIVEIPCCLAFFCELRPSLCLQDLPSDLPLWANFMEQSGALPARLPQDNRVVWGARHQPLINLSASPASKNFLQEPHTAHAAHKAAAGIKQVPSQIKASIDNTGVALQIKGSASPWEPLRIAFQMEAPKPLRRMSRALAESNEKNLGRFIVRDNLSELLSRTLRARVLSERLATLLSSHMLRDPSANIGLRVVRGVCISKAHY